MRLGIFFPALQSLCGTSPGRDVNVISFHMALQQANVTAESGARTALPQPPLQSASVALDGPLKCVIHPCPLSGVSIQKTGLPWDTALKWKCLCEDVRLFSHRHIQPLDYSLTNQNYLLTLGQNYEYICVCFFCDDQYLFYLFTFRFDVFFPPKNTKIQKHTQASLGRSPNNQQNLVRLNMFYLIFFFYYIFRTYFCILWGLTNTTQTLVSYFSCKN